MSCGACGATTGYPCSPGCVGPLVGEVKRKAFAPSPVAHSSGEVITVDPLTGGMKGVKPERFDLIPWPALEEVARVYGWGAAKYEDWNWLKGYAWGKSFGALVRHAARWAAGEDNDQESGLSHLAHVTWHCLTLITYAQRKLGTDDRKKAL